MYASIPCTGFLDVPEFLVSDESLVAFEVNGSALVGDAILDGDYALVDPGVIPADGDIAAVLVRAGNGAGLVLQHVWQAGPDLRLESSNAEFPPVMVTPAEDPYIVGALVGIQRVLSHAQSQPRR